MWVRSQDNYALGNFTLFNVQENGDDYEIIGTINTFEEGVVLGQYDSRRKAIDVLDKIMDGISCGKNIFEMPIG